MARVDAVVMGRRRHSFEFLLSRAAFAGHPRTARWSLPPFVWRQSGSKCRSTGSSRSVPPFNPDLDTDTAPVGVVRFRAALEACDAILICSPEYAHGVSGVLKNALDWIVGSGELMDKPIALINASGRATLAYASLRETLTTMSGRVR